MPIVTLAVIAAAIGCSGNAPSPAPSPTPTPTPDGLLPNLVGPYLGQTPPGAGFTQFAPGVVSGNIYNSPTVSPDGQEIYWAEPRTGIVVARMTAAGRWTTPALVSFGGTASGSGDESPVVSPDNRTLFFNVQTPGARSGYTYWYAERTASGWSERRAMPSVISSLGADHWHVSATNDGTLYFGVLSDTGRIYRARFTGGTYQTPEPVEVANALGYVIAPFVAPDESYLIFGRVIDGAGNGGWVTFKLRDGQWSAPQKLTQVPSDAETAFVTRDGRYLLCRCYWASAQIIDGLRPAER